MQNNKINMDILLKNAESIQVNTFDIQDAEKVILDFFKNYYEKYGDVWILQTQVVSKLVKYSNVKNKMEKLAIKGLLEARLYGTRKIYRLKVSDIAI